jgi:pimeloyl-ACP methyl ester carboxylesterase
MGTGGSSPLDGEVAADGAIEGVSLVQLAVGEMVFDARVAGPANGETVILLHGFPETSYEWRAELRALAQAGYRVVAPDQRGYSPGARPADVDQYAVLQLVGDLLGIADAVGAQRFHLVGHDWGAGVGWGTAIVSPSRVISFTSISVPHPDAWKRALADPTSCQYQASSYFDLFVTPQAVSHFLDDDQANLWENYPGVPVSDVAVYVRALGTVPAMTAALDWYRANISNRQFTIPDIGPVSVPTMLIWGKRDPFFCTEPIDATAGLVSGAYRLEVLNGNHWLPEEASDQVSALILQQLRANPGQ